MSNSRQPQPTHTQPVSGSQPLPTTTPVGLSADSLEVGNPNPKAHILPHCGTGHQGGQIPSGTGPLSSVKWPRVDHDQPRPLPQEGGRVTLVVNKPHRHIQCNLSPGHPPGVICTGPPPLIPPPQQTRRYWASTGPMLAMLPGQYWQNGTGPVQICKMGWHWPSTVCQNWPSTGPLVGQYWPNASMPVLACYLPSTVCQ